MLKNFEVQKGSKGDVILVDAEKLDKLILSKGVLPTTSLKDQANYDLGGLPNDVFEGLNAPDGKYYILRAVTCIWNEANEEEAECRAEEIEEWFKNGEITKEVYLVLRKESEVTMARIHHLNNTPKRKANLN